VRTKAFLFAVAAVFAVAAIGTPVPSEARQCRPAAHACSAAAGQQSRACRLECGRFPDRAERRACVEGCSDARGTAAAHCRQVADRCAAVCAAGESEVACSARVRSCRGAARDAHGACRAACAGQSRLDRPQCKARCHTARAAAEAACGFAAVPVQIGAPVLPDLPAGQPADLSLLEQAERDVVATADAQVDGLRNRSLRVAVGVAGTEVAIEQTRHGFAFGFPIDLRRLTNPADLAFYTDVVSRHFSVAVLENNAKWAKIEAVEGVRDYSFVDDDVDWGVANGFVVKGHTLQWGIVPPFSSSAVPPWAISRFGPLPLSASDQEELREMVRTFVVETTGRYAGRITTWDVTNETLQPLGQWFVQRLGTGIVDDAYRWAHEADPFAQLVFNEWIVEVFTGFAMPTAAQMRDRVLQLRAAGVPVHAVGQQAHFVPGIAFAGVPVDLSQRTAVDDYAVALETLAEAGLPIHITETNFIAPDDPELRAAHAEALMRLWWGTPAVEQVVFWGPWNKVAGRDEFDVGIWDDDGNLSRHGAAILSLLNDRWRTRAVLTSDANGVVEIPDATLGEYVATWTAGGQPRHARFTLERGPGGATIAVGG